MRKLAVVAFLVVALIAGAIGVTLAQAPASPPAGGATAQEIPGATVETIAQSTSESGNAGSALYRIRLEPGTEVPEHEHLGAVTWYVDSGSVTLTVTEGEVWVRCADCLPDASRTEAGDVLVPLGTEVVLQAGDWMIQHADVVHSYRNAGDEPAVIEASTTYSTAEAATPAAGPPVRPRGCQGGCL